MSDDYQTACAVLILIGLLLLCVAVGIRVGAWVGTMLAGGVFLTMGAYLAGGVAGSGK